MEVWAVTLDTSAVEELEELYQRGLSLVDADSQVHLKKYYHRVDRVRGLIGRLLPRLLLKQRGVSVDAVRFSKTDAGKPYIVGLNSRTAVPRFDHILGQITQLKSAIGYNITHDNGVVAMAYSVGSHLYPDPPAYRIGIDAMLLQIPKRDTFPGFVEIFYDQLTDLERSILLPPPPTPPISKQEELRRFYLIWTLKEAYTKALGLGMGFDFSRIEYDVLNDVVRIDGQPPRGWEFTRFELQVGVKGGGVENYVAVTARFIGEDGAPAGKVQSVTEPVWLKLWDSKQFLSIALRELEPSK
ncbi:hypothetical protein BD413DRAFT_678515 [Trametes elegans]|nr:hypothetical protein BD413DRAFT_678515 [Trametes elegans]